MKLVTLMENKPISGFSVEHGLSLYLETDGLRILFDAGQSGDFAENAEKLGIDLGTVDLAVLSHGHYDHGGGLGRFLQVNSHAQVYVNQHAFGRHYNASGKYIGLDPALLQSDRLVMVKGAAAPAPGLTLHTLDAPPEDSAGLMFEIDGQRQPEDFRHEQYLLIREGEKKILISGCSHKGIRTIASHFRPDVLVGGFHLMKVEDRIALETVAHGLRDLGAMYYTGHCTGKEQYQVIKAILGERLEYLETGKAWEI